MMRRGRRHRLDGVKIARRSAGALLLGALLLSCVWGYRSLVELVAVYGENRCRNLVTQIVMDAAALQKVDEKLYYFTNTEKQQVIALNGEGIRRFQTEMCSSLTKQLNMLGEQVYPVPIGTVIGGVLLMGRGPVIEIRYLPVGSAQLRVRSRLQSAGVNQVLYQVVLEVDMDMTVVLPGGNKHMACDQTLVLEEVLISGQVPYVYSG